MQAFQITLKCLALGIFGVSLVHIVFGVSSEVFLGSAISAASQVDPNLDSQNRFYGAAFSLFGVVFWLSGNDLARYETLLKITLLVFFLSGAVRAISIALVGWPTPEILTLTAIEILGPPGMLLWLQRIRLSGDTAL